MSPAVLPFLRMSTPTADHRSGGVQADLRRLVPTLRWASVVVAGRPRMLALFVAAGVVPVVVVAGAVDGPGEPILPQWAMTGAHLAIPVLGLFVTVLSLTASVDATRGTDRSPLRRVRESARAIPPLVLLAVGWVLIGFVIGGVTSHLGGGTSVGSGAAALVVGVLYSVPFILATVPAVVRPCGLPPALRGVGGYVRRAPGRALSFSGGLLATTALLGHVSPVRVRSPNGVPTVTGPTVETSLVWVLGFGLVLPVLWVALGRAYLDVEGGPLQ